MRWDDQPLGVAWPLDELGGVAPQLSAKDVAAPLLVAASRSTEGWQFATTGRRAAYGAPLKQPSAAALRCSGFRPAAQLASFALLTALRQGAASQLLKRAGTRAGQNPCAPRRFRSCAARSPDTRCEPAGGTSRSPKPARAGKAVGGDLGGGLWSQPSSAELRPARVLTRFHL